MAVRQPPSFALRFPFSDIGRWEAAYWATCSAEDRAREQEVETQIAPAVQSQGFLTKDDLLSLCRWKSPRAVPQARRNDAEYVRAVTQTALAADSERLRIEVLTLLWGVGWPMASVILHFGCADLYPILDVRALWAAGVEDVSAAAYDFALWQAYTLFCRRTAQEAGVTLRVLDRALWGCAVERQGKRSSENRVVVPLWFM